LPENPKLFPSLWKRVVAFISRNGVDKAQQDAMWGILYVLNKAKVEDQEQQRDK